MDLQQNKVGNNKNKRKRGGRRGVKRGLSGKANQQKSLILRNNPKKNSQRAVSVKTTEPTAKKSRLGMDVSRANPSNVNAAMKQSGKAKICRWFERYGNCRKGDSCPHTHSGNKY